MDSDSTTFWVVCFFPGYSSLIFLKGDNRSTWKWLIHFHCEHWEKISMESQHGIWRDTSCSCSNLHCNYSDNFCLLKHQDWSGYPEGERNSVGEFQPNLANLGWEVQHFLCIGLKVISMAKGILWETGKQAERKLEILKAWSWTEQTSFTIPYSSFIW